MLTPNRCRGAEPHVRCTLVRTGNSAPVPQVTVAPAGTIYTLYLFSSFPGLFHSLFLILNPLHFHLLYLFFFRVFVAIYLSLRLYFLQLFHLCSLYPSVLAVFGRTLSDLHS